MNFKPFLAPNEGFKPEDLKYPLYGSYKLDGIRCIFKNGEMLSRALKPIVNKQLQEKFEYLKTLSKKHNIILDGELYIHGATFQEIVHYVMTEDFKDEKSIKKYKKIIEIPKELKFYCFDAIKDENYNTPFSQRYIFYVELETGMRDIIIALRQDKLKNSDDVKKLYQQALDNGYEGLILRDINSPYKLGRGTFLEGYIFKFKPYKTFDGYITGVVQATEVDPEAERTVNELGNSCTSRKKDDRFLIEKAAGFFVIYNNVEQKVTLSMTDEEKIEVWKNRDDYIGKWIEFKGMEIGAKDRIRHPVMIRFRDDKSNVEIKPKIKPQKTLFDF